MKQFKRNQAWAILLSSSMLLSQASPIFATEMVVSEETAQVMTVEATEEVAEVAVSDSDNGGYTSGTEGWYPITKSIEQLTIAEDWSYYLASEKIELTSGIVVKTGCTLNLSLNGNELTLKDNTEGSVITVEEGATLNLYGGDTGTYYGYWDDGDYIVTTDNSEIANTTVDTLSGGVITGGTGSATKYVSGGGIFNEGIVNMYSGNIASNTATYGGGVRNKGTFNMSGGSITGNNSTLGGGLHNTTEIVLSGGTISNNIAVSGGGIYNAALLVDEVQVNNLTLTAGTISGNTANYGGGVYNEGTVTLSKGTISKNNANINGGGILNKGTMTITGTTIKSNEAESGGGIHNQATLDMTNGKVTSNTATENGGGIRNSSNGTLSITGGDISGNTIYVKPTEVTVEEGETEEPEPEKSGISQNGTLTLNSGVNIADPVELLTGKLITIGTGFSTISPIPVSATAEQAFTSGASETHLTSFTSADGSHAIEVVGDEGDDKDELKLVEVNAEYLKDMFNTNLATILYEKPEYFFTLDHTLSSDSEELKAQIQEIVNKVMNTEDVEYDVTLAMPSNSFAFRFWINDEQAVTNNIPIRLPAIDLSTLEVQGLEGSVNGDRVTSTLTVNDTTKNGTVRITSTSGLYSELFTYDEEGTAKKVADVTNEDGTTTGGEPETWVNVAFVEKPEEEEEVAEANTQEAVSYYIKTGVDKDGEDTWSETDIIQYFQVGGEKTKTITLSRNEKGENPVDVVFELGVSESDDVMLKADNTFTPKDQLKHLSDISTGSPVYNAVVRDGSTSSDTVNIYEAIDLKNGEILLFDGHKVNFDVGGSFDGDIYTVIDGEKTLVTEENKDKLVTGGTYTEKNSTDKHGCWNLATFEMADLTEEVEPDENDGFYKVKAILSSDGEKIENGTLTKGTASVGATVTLVKGQDLMGYQFDRFNVWYSNNTVNVSETTDSNENTIYTFLMPSDSVAVTAIYKKMAPKSIEIKEPTGITSFPLNTTYDLSDVVFTVTYPDGTTNEVNYLNNEALFTVTKPNSNTIASGVITFNLKDTSLVAQMDVNVVPEITFDSQNNTSLISRFASTDKTLVDFPSDPSYTGNVFNGWYTKASGGDKVDRATIFEANTTVYAQWTQVAPDLDPTYTVTLNPNGGSVVDFSTELVTDTNGKLINLTTLPTPVYDDHTFKGWYLADKTTPVTAETEFTQNTTIYAQWEANPEEPEVATEFTITFVYADNTTKTETFKTEGTLTSFPANPSYTDHKFLGWFTTVNGGSVKVEADYKFTGDTLVLAQWEKEETSTTPESSIYTITFFNNDETITTSTQKTGEDGKLSSLPTLTRDGYSFEGWYLTSATETAEKVTTSTVFEDHATVIAYWTENAKTYTITFDSKDGTTVSPVTTSGTITLPTNPTKTGYTFDVWMTATGEKVTTSTTFTANTTIYAQWTEITTSSKQHTITLDYAVSGMTIFYTKDDGTLAQIPTPTKEGYTFSCWAKGSTNGDTVTTSTVFTADTKIYSLWTKNSTTTDYDDYESALTEDNTLSTLDFPTETEIDDSYFTGWYIQGTNTQVTVDTVLPEDAVIVANYKVKPSNANAVLTVKLENKANNIPTDVLNTLNSLNIVGNMHVFVGSDGKILNSETLPTLSVDGYDFNGWLVSQSDVKRSTSYDQVTADTVYTDDAYIYPSLSKTVEGSHKISLNANGGSFSGTSTFTTDADGILTTTLPTPTLTGHTFLGWYMGETEVNKTTVFTGDTTIFANWQKDSTDDFVFDVTLNANGGTLNTSKLTTANTGTLTSLPTPSLANHSFKGWFTEATGGTQVTTNFRFTEATTIYAQWSSFEFTIIFDAQGGTQTISSSETNKYGKLTSLPTTTLSGHIFQGWFTEDEDGTQITTSTVFADDSKVYAQWAERTSTDAPFVITFDAGKGEASVETLETDEDGILEELPTAERSGYTFVAWYTDEDEDDGDEVDEDTEFEEDTTLYAIWTANSAFTSDIITESSNSTSYGGKIYVDVDEAYEGDKVVISVSPYNGYILESLTVIDGDGDEVELWGNNFGDSYYFNQPDSDVEIIAVFYQGSSLPSVTNPTPSQTSDDYYDVTKADWHEQYIDYVARLGIMSGSNGLFNPNVATTRGSIADSLMALSRQTGYVNTSNLSFTDVNGTGHETGIAWCVANGVMTGYNNSSFGTYDSLTREQFATTLASFAKAVGLPSTPQYALSGQYHDGNSISSWALSSFTWCIENGLIVGHDDILYPQNTLTRAEVAAMLTSFHKKFGSSF